MPDAALARADAEFAHRLALRQPILGRIDVALMALRGECVAKPKPSPVPDRDLRKFRRVRYMPNEG
jgi:hypothetical protein